MLIDWQYSHQIQPYFLAYISFQVCCLIHKFFQSLATLENSLDVLCHDTLHLLHLRLQCRDLVISAATFLWETLLKHRQYQLPLHWHTERFIRNYHCCSLLLIGSEQMTANNTGCLAVTRHYIQSTYFTVWVLIRTTAVKVTIINSITAFQQQLCANFIISGVYDLNLWHKLSIHCSVQKVNSKRNVCMMPLYCYLPYCGALKIALLLLLLLLLLSSSLGRTAAKASDSDLLLQMQ